MTSTPDYYARMTDRNTGCLSSDQQQRLKNSCVALFGLGGLGGVIAEIFARAGIGHLKIVDNDIFDESNLNRQIFAFTDTIGRMKTDVTEEFLKRINPEIRLEKFTRVDQENINDLLNGAQAAVLALDSVKPIIAIARAARGKNIPLVEGWALPFLNIRVFTAQTISLEDAYGFPTTGRALSSIPDEEFHDLKLHMLSALKKIEGIDYYYPPLAIERIQMGKIPSFSPHVWLTAVAMAFETFKILLQTGPVTLAPSFALYNPYMNVIPRQET